MVFGFPIHVKNVAVYNPKKVINCWYDLNAKLAARDLVKYGT